jgi:hypothetical protein
MCPLCIISKHPETKTFRISFFRVKVPAKYEKNTAFGGFFGGFDGVGAGIFWRRRFDGERVQC